jgi:nucleotide-binding universal stress UspA family protein
MTIVVGIDPTESNDAVIALAARLHRLMRTDVVLATVRPPTIEIPSRGNVDSEWTSFLHAQAQQALESAAQLMKSHGVEEPITTRIVVKTSVSRGLRNLAAEINGTVIAIGTGSTQSTKGLELGSVVQSLLHSGETAVALAPRADQESSTDITRLVVGFEPTAESEAVVASALTMAGVTRVPVELLTVVVRVTRLHAPRLGSDPESDVLQAITEQALQEQARMRAAHPKISAGNVKQADNVRSAMELFEWNSGDLFVLGSSTDGLLRRVFLGDMSHQLLRAASVPVLVMPRVLDA